MAPLLRRAAVLLAGVRFVVFRIYLSISPRLKGDRAEVDICVNSPMLPIKLDLEWRGTASLSTEDLWYSF